MVKMGKKSLRRSHKQKLYKMKGCSKKTCRNYLGGKSSGDVQLAYPTTGIKIASNPFLAYIGKGGAITDLAKNVNLNTNTNGVNKVLPSTGPPANGFNFLNPQDSQYGGCGCASNMQLGGGCGTSMCPLAMSGGAHRPDCKCSMCKMKGGSGIPYPNGLVGQSWTPSTSGWPGVDGLSGNRNYLENNAYSPNDISRQMIATGANPPFSIGGGKGRKYNKKTRRNQRGGVVSNFLSQDLINLGRQFQYGLGSAYNALAGYSAPVNPMPWKGQLPNTPNLTTVKAASI
jgi:hypothetical protein